MITSELNKFVCLNLVIRIWGGQKGLSFDDLKIKDVDPKTIGIIRPGTKRIFPKSVLNDFLAIRRQAERYCQIKGVRFLGGYAIPATKAAEITAHLDTLKRAFLDLKKEVMDNYEPLCADWLNQVPAELKDVIKAGMEPKEEVEKAFGFDFQAFNVMGIDGLNDGLQKAVDSLGDQLIYEISKDAQSIYKDSFEGRMKVSQKAMRPIRSMIDKADSLSFLDPKFDGIVDNAKGVMAQIPKKGYLEGVTRSAMIGVLDDFSAMTGNIIKEDLDEELEEQPASSALDAWF